MFQPGQEYTALSRVRGRQHLQLLNWNGQLRSSNEAVQYYKCLRRGEAYEDDLWKRYCGDEATLFGDFAEAAARAGKGSKRHKSQPPKTTYGESPGDDSAVEIGQ